MLTKPEVRLVIDPLEGTDQLVAHLLFRAGILEKVRQLHEKHVALGFSKLYLPSVLGRTRRFDDPGSNNCGAARTFGQDDASTTMINEGGLGVRSPLDG